MSNLANLLTRAQALQYRGLKQAKARKQEGLFLLEGVRLCQEAIHSDLTITACITSKGFDKVELPPGLNYFEATPTQIEQISDSKSPQGIICVAKIPELKDKVHPETTKTLLVLDRLADPGNMGTIFRSALWFGIQDILLGPDCVDPYSPKVVRSSMGAITKLTIHTSSDLVASAEDWQSKGGELIALHMDGTALQTFASEKSLFLIVGSEAHGVESGLLNISNPISIEKPGSGESLNAAMATGIALYELTRRN